ncbi:hypothetical protein DMA12_27590 [Amycolatopsis balhimycina DSM 5908]|uniref:Uncharacterized protein n=1 Tax=Amycolatopsis balhimycina DSM 5908 TaxID=1081091 RepID=A0A428WAP3_AMYBA|nr:hypothetical protein [Amycolatopsis balhimycina]RSM40185.1 hypothetical protein DMA12_27590 [Amycolatopsis balhimycina DSM 5908]
MTPETAELITSLGSVHRAVPTVVRELATGTMPPERQRQFAGLLAELADVVAAHAGEPAASETPMALADRLALSGRQLMAVGARLRAGTMSRDRLQEVSGWLAALGDVVGLYAEQLPASPVTPKQVNQPEPPPDAPPEA